MAAPYASWNRSGVLHSWPSSAEKEHFQWDVRDFLQNCREGRVRSGKNEKKLESGDFSFAGATWNLSFAVDHQKFQSRFGISVRTHSASDTMFECYCRYKFNKYVNDVVIKKSKCKFKCESPGSSWAEEDFLSDSELDMFLRDGCLIICIISIKRSSNSETCPPTEINDFSSCANVEVPTQAPLLKNDSREFRDSTWPLGGLLYREHISAFVIDVQWDIFCFLQECWKAKEKSGESNRRLKSVDFSFGDATFNLFTSFDAKGSHSKFGINFRPCHSSNDEFDCCCKIASKNFECQFKCQNTVSHWKVMDFLSESELKMFLHSRGIIRCRISRKEFSDACSPTELTHCS